MTIAAAPKTTATVKIKSLQAEVTSLKAVVEALKNALLDLDVHAWSVKEMMDAAAKGEEVGYNG